MRGRSYLGWHDATTQTLEKLTSNLSDWASALDKVHHRFWHVFADEGRASFFRGAGFFNYFVLGESCLVVENRQIDQQKVRDHIDCVLRDCEQGF